MIQKQCCTCKQIQSIDEFNKNKARKDGYSRQCRICQKKAKAKYRQSDKYRECQAEYKARAAVCTLRYARGTRGRQRAHEYRQTEASKERDKEYYRTHKKQIQIKKAEWVKRNWERLYLKHLAYCRTEKGKESCKKYRKQYMASKGQEPKFRVNRAFSSHIRYALKKKEHTKNNQRWVDIVGYNIEELMSRLEDQFQDGMTWDNYGEWEVDHIIPISRFNFNGVTDWDFQRCWALENLQPLWQSENRSKSDKLMLDFQPCLSL